MPLRIANIPFQKSQKKIFCKVSLTMRRAQPTPGPTLYPTRPGLETRPEQMVKTCAVPRPWRAILSGFIPHQCFSDFKRRELKTCATVAPAQFSVGRQGLAKIGRSRQSDLWYNAIQAREAPATHSPPGPAFLRSTGKGGKKQGRILFEEEFHAQATNTAF